MIQNKILQTVTTRGIPNPRTAVRGLLSAAYVEEKLGGRGVPCVEHILNKTLLRVLEDTVYKAHTSVKFIHRALQADTTLRRDVTAAAGFYGATLKVNQDEVASLSAIPVKNDRGRRTTLAKLIGENADILAVDADGACVLGFASLKGTTVESVSIRVEGTIRSSYEAELLGISMGLDSKPKKVICDNLAALTDAKVGEIHNKSQLGLLRRLTLHPHKSACYFAGVKGHQDDSTDMEQMLNVEADRQTRTEDPRLSATLKHWYAEGLWNFVKG